MTTAITNGPSKDELLGALGADTQEGATVTFQTADGPKQVHIAALGREEGTGTIFLFADDMPADPQGVYNTSTRSGEMN